MAYEAAGRTFAGILVNSIGGKAHYADKPTNPYKNDQVIASEIAAGILYGITNQEDFEFFDCFKKPDDFVFNMQIIYQYMTSRTYAGIVDGVTLALEHIKNIEPAVSECSVFSNQFATWAKTANTADLQDNIQYNLQKQKN